MAGVCCLLITGSAVAVYYEKAHIISSARGSLDRFWIAGTKTRSSGHMPPGLDEASNHHLHSLPLSQQCWSWLPTLLLVNTIFPDESIIVSFECVLTKEPELVAPPPSIPPAVADTTEAAREPIRHSNPPPAHQQHRSRDPPTNPGRLEPAWTVNGHLGDRSHLIISRPCITRPWTTQKERRRRPNLPHPAHPS